MAQPGIVEFVLLNSLILLHNLGSFGFYSWRIGIVEYDSLVHFISAFIGAYIIFHLIVQQLQMRRLQHVAKTIIDERLLLLFLVMSSVAMLGTMVELIEFTGFLYFGEGEGILFNGAGDSDHQSDIASNYKDTMGDLFVNTLGSMMGASAYYFLRCRSR